MNDEVSQSRIDALEKRLARAKARETALTRLIETRSSELFEEKQRLEKNYKRAKAKEVALTRLIENKSREIYEAEVQRKHHLAMLKNEMELARKIQQSLLAGKIPEIAGLNITVRYRSMINIGGDYYDFRTDESGVGIIMADVSGHGVPAALIVSIVKMAFWFQKESLTAPDRLFQSMNEILMGNIGNEFVTASYFFIDPERNRLVAGNAGHPPLLVWKRNRKELLKMRPFGRVLGFFPEAKFEVSEISLDPGDRILMYTDGVCEAANSKMEEFSEKRLDTFVAEQVEMPVDDFASKMIKSVTDWCGGEDKIGDDIAIIVIDVES